MSVKLLQPYATFIQPLRQVRRVGGGGGGGGGCGCLGLNQTLRIRVAGLEDNFSWPYGPHSYLKNKQGALASPEPLFGLRSANAIKPFT